MIWLASTCLFFLFLPTAFVIAQFSIAYQVFAATVAAFFVVVIFVVVFACIAVATAAIFSRFCYCRNDLQLLQIGGHFTAFVHYNYFFDDGNGNSKKLTTLCAFGHNVGH